MCKYAKENYQYENQLHDAKSHFKTSFYLSDMSTSLKIWLKAIIKISEVCYKIFYKSNKKITLYPVFDERLIILNIIVIWE